MAAPDSLLDAVDVACAIRPCLEKLSPVQRSLVGLAFFEGLTHGEIAAATDLPLGSVKSHIHRALASLRAQLSIALDAGSASPAARREENFHG
jgi:RNA polymerase sigma-70 factor (ECF subfamily)